MNLHLHFAVLFHKVGRETLHIPLVQERNVENPLSPHLVLNVQLEEQLVHPYWTHAVVLGNLCDSDGLRAAQDDAGIVGQRFLLCGDFFEQGVFAFQQSVLL